MIGGSVGRRARRGRTGGTGSLRFVVFVIIGTALLQVSWIAVVPPFRGSDEFDHAYRAAGVAGGQWRATEAPEDGRGLLVVASDSLVRAAHEQCASLSYTGPDNCSPVEELGNGRVLVASGAANYNPVFYWVIGTVAEPFGGANALYAMRVAGALLCLLFIGLAAWTVAIRRQRTWSDVGLLVAMTPVLVFSTTVAAPNGLEMAAALALWSALLGLDGSLEAGTEKRMLFVAIVAAAVMCLLRMLGPMFVLLIVLTAWALHPGMVQRTAVVHRRLFVGGCLAVLGSVAAATAWILSTGSLKPGPEPQGGEWGPESLILWPLQSIAAFPYRDQPGAMMVYPVVLMAFGAIVLTALRLGNKRERVVLLLTMAVALGIPLAITAATYAGRGAMWQGRYGLPYSVGIVLVAAVILDRSLSKSRWRGGLVLIGGGLMAVATAACLVKVLNDELKRATSAGDPAWHAPSIVVVLVLTFAAWAALTFAAGKPRHVGR